MPTRIRGKPDRRHYAQNQSHRARCSGVTADSGTLVGRPDRNQGGGSGPWLGQEAVRQKRYFLKRHCRFNCVRVIWGDAQMLTVFAASGSGHRCACPSGPCLFRGLPDLQAPRRPAPPKSEQSPGWSSCTATAMGADVSPPAVPDRPVSTHRHLSVRDALVPSSDAHLTIGEAGFRLGIGRSLPVLSQSLHPFVAAPAWPRGGVPTSRSLS